MPEDNTPAKDSTDILKLVIQFIGQNQLAAIPVNYTVLYEYFSNAHPLLNQVFDEAITAKTLITDDVMQKWFDKFLKGFDLIELSQSQSELHRIANQLTAITTQAQGNVSKFDISLTECKNEMSANPDNVSLTSVVAMLMNSTSSMQLAMEKMDQKINASQQEITSLQSRLDIATVEAVTDPLTGLLNRKGLMMAIEKALSDQDKLKPFPCLLMLDIDRFKSINDKYGHSIGDRAIKIVADTLKNQTKGKDTTTRYGGEEFAVLLPNTELQNAMIVAENIRKTTETIKIKRIDDESELCRMTISIGITQYQSDLSITNFIEQADLAMYQSKNSGRNQTTVYKS